MNFTFDLISDIHRETWSSFDWEGQPTAPYCIVAGDIARDRALVIDTLDRLSDVYSGVFYVDGNDEHKDYAEEIGRSYAELHQLIKPIGKVVFLQDNVVIINGVAILGTNGWWDYNFDPNIEFDQSVQWLIDKEKISAAAAANLKGISHTDVGYMTNAVQKLQTHTDVKTIVLVTHTVPHPELIQHDLDLIHTWRFNSMGNSGMQSILREDTESKINTWCFGHYHRPVDTVIDGIRYDSNPRGRGNTPYSQIAFYPKRITITI